MVFFDLVSDNLLRQKIVLNENEDPFEVPFSINNTYIDDDTRQLTLSIDDILTLSKPDEEFYYELHMPKSPEDVLYSTKM